ncbi:MAG: hypothetical protein GWP08_12050 [Nitrospiraceae bacterium]|nr:hypothetical protein [Nitrospiraceae bacterium]
MNAAMNAMNGPASAQEGRAASTRLLPRDLRLTLKVKIQVDKLEIGKNTRLTTDQATNAVLMRAMDKLRAVVSDARSALGMPEDAIIDTSAEATANRIADFALSAFDKWSKNHSEAGGEEARQQFADFIGGAIAQGISEARDILSALDSLSPEVDSNIDSTWQIIQQRLQDFVAGN